MQMRIFATTLVMMIEYVLHLICLCHCVLYYFVIIFRLVGDGQRGDEPLVGDPRVLLARVPRAGARDAGHVAGGRAYGAARLRVRGAGRAARQAGLHVHAHRRGPHLLRA